MLGKFKKFVKRKLRLEWGKAWWLRAKLQSPYKKQLAHNYLEKNQNNLVFLTGTGRSGTQLIADLLNNYKDASFFHEPNYTEDVSTMVNIRKNLAMSKRYWQNFRSLEVYRRWMENNDKSIYGEVNATIRYQIPAIKLLYPNSKLFILARDGRDVVRSIMNRPQHFSPKSTGAYALSPLDGDRFYLEYPTMDRFEKICWLWQETNELLMQNIPRSNWLLLENLIKDYEYSCNRLFQPLGIEISEETWRFIVSRKSDNATKQHGFPVWEDWTDKQKSSFRHICGNTMKRLGYVF